MEPDTTTTPAPGSSTRAEYLRRADGDEDRAAVLLARDLMRGDPETLRAGYSGENAALAAARLFGLDAGAILDGLHGTMPGREISLPDAIDAAASLFDRRDHPADIHAEYVRGVTETLARCFPLPEVDTGTRAEQLRAWIDQRVHHDERTEREA